MKNIETIYAISNEILLTIVEIISNINNGETEKIVQDLIDFLNNDNTRYEEIFENNKYDLSDNKKYCKDVMKLIIISSVYKDSFYLYTKEIDADYNECTMYSTENLTPIEIIRMFKDWTNNQEIGDYLYQYLDYTEKNYIYYDHCLDTLIKNDKIDNLLEINPFEILNIENKNEIKNLSTIENYIQIYIDNYDSAFYKEEEDFESTNTIFKENIYKYFENDINEINKFYSYILGNLYENLVICCMDVPSLKKNYKNLFLILENFSTDEIIKMIFDNENMFDEFSNLFLEFNENLLPFDLYHKRNKFNKSSNKTILEKINPYCIEENEELKVKQKKRSN